MAVLIIYSIFITVITLKGLQRENTKHTKHSLTTNIEKQFLKFLKIFIAQTIGQQIFFNAEVKLILTRTHFVSIGEFDENKITL